MKIITVSDEIRACLRTSKKFSHKLRSFNHPKFHRDFDVKSAPLNATTTFMSSDNGQKNDTAVAHDTRCLHDSHGKVKLGKFLSDEIPNLNGWKQGDALSLLLFSIALEYAIRKLQKESDWNCKRLVSIWNTLIMLICWTEAGINILKKNTDAVLAGSLSRSEGREN